MAIEIAAFDPLDVTLVEPATATRAAPGTEPPMLPAAHAHGPPQFQPVPRAIGGVERAPRRAITAPAMASERATGTETSPRAAGSHPDRGSLLAMRRGEVPRLALPAGRWDDLDHPPRGSAPAPAPAVSGLLHDAGGGAHRSDQQVFQADVAPDGSVALHDAPSLRVHVALPRPEALGRALADWYTSDKGVAGEDADTAMSKQIQMSAGSTAAVADPVTGVRQDRATTVILPVLGGSFDATDWMARRHGSDPYAARKLALLDATRDQRAAAGAQHRAAELARTAQIVHDQLTAL